MRPQTNSPPAHMSNLYRYIPILRRLQNGVVLYRVFEVIGIGFTVQSKDFFPAEAPAGAAASLEAKFLELLIEQGPHHRFGTSSTIEAAVLAFDQYFESTANT